MFTNSMKTLVLSIMLIAIMAITAHAFIIWDWDSSATTPKGFNNDSNIYTGANFISPKVGLSGSFAGEIKIIPKSHNSFGNNGSWVTFWNGSQISLTPINLTGNPWIYFSIKGSNSGDTCWGVSIELQDSHISNDIPNEGFIPADAQNPITPVQCQGVIPVGTFTTLWFNAATFNYYKQGVGVDPTRHPDLAHITRIAFTLRQVPAGIYSSACSLYLDNIGATPFAPVELSNFEASGSDNNLIDIGNWKIK